MTYADELHLSAIGQIAIPVQDIEQSTAFYGDTLGLRFLFDVPGQMAFFDCGGVRLMLSLPDSGAFDQRGSILYFRVEEIARAHRVLSERGVDFIGPPHRVADMGSYELWMAFFRDPDKTVLALMSEVPMT